MRKYILSTFFLAAIACLSSCSEEREENPVETGRMVDVSLDFGGVSYNEDEDNSATRTTSEEPITSTVTLENGMELQAVLSVDKQEAQTRAASTLASDAKIVVIAYKGGKLYSKSVITPSNAKIKLAEGGQFDLVFYSYNSNSITPDVACSAGSVDSNGLFSSDAVLTPITESYLNVNNAGYNSMWAKTSTGTVTSGMTLPTITFGYLNARLKTVINSRPVDQYGTITKADITYNAAYGYQVGFSNTGAAVTFGTSQEVWLTPESGLGTTQVIYPYRQLLTNGNLIIKIADMTIHGQQFTNKTFIFGKSLTSGKSYTITIAANRPTYKLTFDLNHGAPGDGESMETTYAPRTGITFATQQTLNTHPVRNVVGKKYVFGGWTSNVTVNRFNETTDPGTQIGGNGYFWMPESDVLLTANWIETPLDTSMEPTCDVKTGVASFIIKGNFFAGQTYQFTFTNADAKTSVVRFTADGTATNFNQIDNDVASMQLSYVNYTYNNGIYTWNIQLTPAKKDGLVVDLITNQGECQQYKSNGLCTNYMYEKMMEAYCAKTCDIRISYPLCGAGTDYGGVDCLRNVSLCTEPAYITMMRAYCARTCGFSPGDVTVKCEITSVQ